MTAKAGQIIDGRKIGYSKRVAERMFKEYVWSATGRFESSDLPYYSDPVLVSASTIEDLFLMSISGDFEGVQYKYKDLEEDGEDAVILIATDENGQPLGTLKFIS